MKNKEKSVPLQESLKEHYDTEVIKYLSNLKLCVLLLLLLAA